MSKRINGILKDFEQETTDAYTEPEEGIDYERLGEAYTKATEAIRGLIKDARLEEVQRLHKHWHLTGSDGAFELLMHRHNELDTIINGRPIKPDKWKSTQERKL